MFGKAKRRDAEAMESIREQLAAADMHARSVLSAVAETESRWAKDRDERSRSEDSAERAIESVRSSVVESAADVGRTLRQVADMCAHVVDRLEADTIERRALTEAITLLARQQSAPVDTPSRVLGGTVVSSPESTYTAPVVPSNGVVSGYDAPNGDGSNGGANNGSSNGAARNGDIDLVAYEAAERVASSPLVEPAPPVEEAPRTIERFRPFATPPVATASEPVQVLEPEVVEVVSVGDAEPAGAPVPAAEPVVPEKPFDAFVGLPLLKPKPPTPPVDAVRPEVVDAVAPFAPPAPPAPPTPTPFAAPPTPTPFAAVAPAPVPAPAPVEASDGLERQWSESYQLTENNSFRPHGGTRLTPRRSNNVRTSTS